MLERLELRAELRHAIDARQFELHFQPVVRLHDGSVAGIEALVRWHHPTRGFVQPAQFIPLAEEMGLIVDLGRWVLRESCHHAARLRATGEADSDFTIAVNLSVKQLQHPEIIGDVRSALEDSGIEPGMLVLEITETVLMADYELASRRLQELKTLGVRIAMDDFGTGYSSLSYLSRFPVDILKMDRSFLASNASPQAEGLAAAIVALGESLELEVVAEGIELSRPVPGAARPRLRSRPGLLHRAPDGSDGYARVAGRRRSRCTARRRRTCSIATRHSTDSGARRMETCSAR